jgi:succinate dehydrogenase cytochrome b subunit
LKTGQETVTIEEKEAKPGLSRHVRWIFQRPMNLEKLALAAQRVSGVGMIAYLIAHMFVIGTVTSGATAFGSIMSMFSNPFADIGDFLLVMGAAFHAVNGIRVLLLELTPLAGRPMRPDFPYRIQSLGPGQKSILYAAVVMAVLSGIIAVYVVWGL